jgi:hypothetical protein
LAILSPRPANRHNVGCGGVGADHLHDAAVSRPRGGVFHAR